MNDVAEAAGVTKPVLYQHFESKRELYQALLDEVGARMLAAIVAATSDAPDGRSQTEAGFRAYFRWVAEDHAVVHAAVRRRLAPRRGVQPGRAPGHRPGSPRRSPR